MLLRCSRKAVTRFAGLIAHPNNLKRLSNLPRVRGLTRGYMPSPASRVPSASVYIEIVTRTPRRRLLSHHVFKIIHLPHLDRIDTLSH
jgi:hypothetical protein